MKNELSKIKTKDLLKEFPPEIFVHSEYGLATATQIVSRRRTDNLWTKKNHLIKKWSFHKTINNTNQT